MHHLVGIAFSHYVEKARWALDRYGVPYRESRLLPMLHMPTAAWASRGRGRADRASSPFSTPILITDRGERICDSADIVRYASDRFGEGELYRDARAAELEQRFHDGLARDTRKVGYHFVLGDRDAMRALMSNVGPFQRGLGRATLPLTARALERILGISEPRVARAIERIQREVDEVSEWLRDGRPYLLGDHFSAADIAFACAAIPAILVREDEGLSSVLPSVSQLPPEARALHDALRRTEAGAFALRLFREERVPAHPVSVS